MVTLLAQGNVLNYRNKQLYIVVIDRGLRACI